LKGAKDFLGFFLDTAAARFGRNSTDAKIQTVDFVLPLLARVRNPIALHEHVRQASQFVGIDETLILRQLRQKQPRDTAKLREQIQVVDQSGSRLEQILLKTAIESSQAGPKLLAMIEAEWLTDPRVRKWFLLCKSLGMDGNLTWEDLFSRCDGADDDDARFLRGLALHEFEPLDDSDRTLDHLHARLRRGFLLAESRRLSELCHELFPNDPEGKTWRDKIQARDKALPDLKKAINGSLLGSPLRKSNGV
jgi:DNA primase